MSRRWRKVRSEIKKRQRLLFDTVEQYKEHSDTPESGFYPYTELASVDVFVEKAQNRLTHRARLFFVSGALSTLFTSVLIIFAIYSIRHSPWPDFELSDVYASTNLYVFLAWALRAFAVGGLFLAGAILGAWLARGFLHEATQLMNRRHQLRLGRLFLHLRLLGSGDRKTLNKVKKYLTVDVMEKAFGTGSEASTAFKDIEPDRLRRNALLQFVRDIVSSTREKERRNEIDPKSDARSGASPR